MNLKNDYTSNLRLNKKILTPLFLLCLSVFMISCGKDIKSEEVTVIDSAYLTSTSTHPPVPYPIQIGDEFKIKVGELFGYENVDWASHFPSDFGIRTPEVIEGEGTICVLWDDSFSVLAESPGSCSVKYPSNNGGSEGFVFLTITVVDS